MAEAIASTLVDSLLSRRGRKPGCEKTPGSGRKPGQKNRRTVAVEEAMRPLEPKARRTLRKLLEKGDPETQLRAAALILSYRYGKPVDRREVSGRDGGAIAVTDDPVRSLGIVECSRRQAFAENRLDKLMDAHLVKRLGPAGMELFKRIVETSTPALPAPEPVAKPAPEPVAARVPPVVRNGHMPEAETRPVDSGSNRVGVLEVVEVGQGGRWAVRRTADLKVLTFASTRDQAIALAWDLQPAKAETIEAEPLTADAVARAAFTEGKPS